MKTKINSLTYLTSFILVMGVAIWSPAEIYAQDAAPIYIGYAAQVEGAVTGQVGDADSESIEVGDDIFFSEIITTGPDASAVMSFRDGSSLEIGPNSALTIDEFIFNPVEGVKTQTMTALVGTFRFVSGMAMPNQNITINTPSAIMGISGSTLPMVIGSDGSTAASPTDGTATFAPRGNPSASINIQRGNAGVIRPGGQPQTGPAVSAVGRQVVSRARQVLGARVNIPPRTQDRRTRDAQANQQPAATQEQQQAAAPAPAAQQAATQAVLATRSDQTLDNQGLDSVAQLDAAGVLGTGAAALNANQQAVVDSLDAATTPLQAILDAGLVDGQAASQSNHQQATSDVITGLSQTGTAADVTAATGNAAQADPNQAAPAVNAAAANLPNLDANTMTEVLQSAVDGLQTGGDDVTGNTVGSLTATAINSMPADTQQTIGNDVAVAVTTDYATQNPNQAADLAATLTTQISDTASNIATTATQNLALQVPAQAQAINTAATNAAAANIGTLPTPAAGAPGIPTLPAGGALVNADGVAQEVTTENELQEGQEEVISTVAQSDPTLFDPTTVEGVTPNQPQ